MAVLNWSTGQSPPIVGPHNLPQQGPAYLYGGVPGGGGTAGGVGGPVNGGNPFFRAPHVQVQNPISGTPANTVGNGVTVGAAAPQSAAAPQAGIAPPSNTIASITSVYGNPVLPYGDQNLNQQTTNRLFESALGQQGLASMLQHLRPANNGMAATAGDQMLVNPAITQSAASGAGVLANTPYQQNLANANALLNWQTGQSNDILGQFKNLAGVNEAQQNFGLSNILGGMDYNLGTAGNKIDLLQSLLGGLMGPNSIIGSLTSGLTSGLGSGLSGALGGLSGGGALNGLSGLTGLA